MNFKNMFKKESKAVEAKIDRSTEQMLELETQKKRLEIDIQNIQLELDNQKKRFSMTLEETAHKQKLDLESKKAVFEREKEIWTAEKKEIEARSGREKKELEETLRKQHEITLQEAVSLAKLESQQKVKQAEIDRDREINRLKTEHAEALAKVKADSAEDLYKRLSTALEDITKNGDKNTKFVQDLAMKVFDKVPANGRIGADIDVNVSNTPRLVDSSKSQPKAAVR